MVASEPLDVLKAHDDPLLFGRISLILFGFRFDTKFGEHCIVIVGELQMFSGSPRPCTQARCTTQVIVLLAIRWLKLCLGDWTFETGFRKIRA